MEKSANEPPAIPFKELNMAEQLTVKEQQLTRVAEELNRNKELYQELLQYTPTSQRDKEINVMRMQSLSRVIAEHRNTIKLIQKL